MDNHTSESARRTYTRRIDRIDRRLEVTHKAQQQRPAGSSELPSIEEAGFLIVRAILLGYAFRHRQGEADPRDLCHARTGLPPIRAVKGVSARQSSTSTRRCFSAP